MPEGEEDGPERSHHLGWKDYLALFIAMLQTVALPLVIMILVVLVFVVLASYIR